jgi:hypothetical protein
MRACKTKTTTNKSKTTKNDFDGILGKSVQYGVQDKPWTGVAKAFVEQQHVFVIFKSQSNREGLYYVP